MPVVLVMVQVLVQTTTRGSVDRVCECDAG